MFTGVKDFSRIHLVNKWNGLSKVRARAVALLHGGWAGVAGGPPGLHTLSLLQLRKVVTSVMEKLLESGVLPVVKAQLALGS